MRSQLTESSLASWEAHRIDDQRLHIVRLERRSNSLDGANRRQHPSLDNINSNIPDARINLFPQEIRGYVMDVEDSGCVLCC